MCYRRTCSLMKVDRGKSSRNTCVVRSGRNILIPIMFFDSLSSNFSCNLHITTMMGK